MVVKCDDCPFKVECVDALCFGYCPYNDDYDGLDYSSAVYREIREQNGEL